MNAGDGIDGESGVGPASGGQIDGVDGGDVESVFVDSRAGVEGSGRTEAEGGEKFEGCWDWEIGARGKHDRRS